MSLSLEVIWFYNTVSASSTYYLFVAEVLTNGVATFKISFDPISRVVLIYTLFDKKAATLILSHLIVTYSLTSFVETRVVLSLSYIWLAAVTAAFN